MLKMFFFFKNPTSTHVYFLRLQITVSKVQLYFKMICRIDIIPISIVSIHVLYTKNLKYYCIHVDCSLQDIK